MKALIKAKKQSVSGLTKQKKEILRKLQGSFSTKLDLNKVRDYLKYEED